MSLTAVIVGGVIPGVFVIGGTFLAWWLRRKPEELDTMGKLRKQIGEQDERIRKLEADRELRARREFAAMRYIERLILHIERDSARLVVAGLTPTPPEPLPDELKPPTGA